MTLVGYSFTFQMIYDANCLVSNLEVKCPGSVHDSRVFRACPIYERLSQGKPNILFVP